MEGIHKIRKQPSSRTASTRVSMDTLFLLLALFIAVILTAVYAVHTFIQLVRLHRGAVPFVRSDRRLVKKILDEQLLPKQGMILDLGCGDGTLLFALERSGYAGPLIGYEHSIHPWASGMLWARICGSNVRLVRGDALHAPLEKASAVYLFLLEEALMHLRQPLQTSLAPGAIVVSAEFAVPGWNPIRILRARGVTSREAPIYLYRAGESWGS